MHINLLEYDKRCLVSDVLHKNWWVHCVTRGFQEMATDSGYSKPIDTAWKAEVNRLATPEDMDRSIRDIPETLAFILGKGR